jgi:hypothetical protein
MIISRPGQSRQILPTLSEAISPYPTEHWPLITVLDNFPCRFKIGIYGCEIFDVNGSDGDFIVI